MLYFRKYHLCDTGQNCGGRKPEKALGKSKTIIRLLADLLMYKKRGSKHELDVSSQPPHSTSGHNDLIESYKLPPCGDAIFR